MFTIARGDDVVTSLTTATDLDVVSCRTSWAARNTLAGGAVVDTSDSDGAAAVVGVIKAEYNAPS